MTQIQRGLLKDKNVQEEIDALKLPKYNTQSSDLKLVSYGRNIQNMVDYCMTIEDKEERTRCAYAIAKTIQKLRIKLQDDATHIISSKKTKSEIDINDHTVWDHIYFMSGNKLDIFYPNDYLPTAMESFKFNPEKIEIRRRNLIFRHYGVNLMNLIAKAEDMPDGAKKDELLTTIGNYMKRCYTKNISTANDQKIFDDIYDISNHKIKIDPNVIKLREIQNEGEATKTETKKKKKHK